MKGLFLMFYGFNAYNGISKKIAYQVKALRNNGLDVRICHYERSDEGERSWMIDGKPICHLGFGLTAKLRKRVDFRAIVSYIEKEKLDFVYWRTYHNANPFTIALAKKIKALGIRLILEIPTYPYDQEYASLREKIPLAVDQLFRHAFCRYVDRIVTFSNDETIFGTPTLRISNGIDFSQIKLHNPQELPVGKRHDIRKELHLIAVAEIHYWHGYDRLIKGLFQYYQQQPTYKVYFHLAGPISGEREQREVADAIAHYELKPYVRLYGPLHGEELERFFQQGDFAIGSLGRHRSGITHLKSLKNREYAARGFAFAYSECDEDFDDMPYVLKEPADESAIHIQDMIDFCQKLTLTPGAIRESIRHLSWDEQMKPIVKFLEQD